MKRILSVILTITILCTVALSLTSCGESPAENSGRPADEGNGAKDAAVAETEPAAKAAMISNDYSELIWNNPNGHFSNNDLACDGSYLYFKEESDDYEPSIGAGSVTLWRVKIGSTAKEAAADITEVYSRSGGDMAYYDGYIYMIDSNRIDRVNIATGAVEKGFIDVDHVPDIENNQNNVTYTGYSTVMQMTFIDDLLLYFYKTEHTGTSATRQFYYACYNFGTGQTTELEIELRPNYVGFDGENLIVFEGDASRAYYLSFADLKAGIAKPDTVQVYTHGQQELIYIAANGFVVVNRNNDVEFYLFEDAVTLKEGEYWEPARVIAQNAPSSTVIGDLNNKTFLYMTDEGGLGYGRGPSVIFRFDGELNYVEQKPRYKPSYCVFVDGVLYSAGYDDSGAFCVDTLSF